MSEVEWLRRWYAYNAVARQWYLATLSKLAPEELTRDRGASFPTLLDYLVRSYVSRKWRTLHAIRLSRDPDSRRPPTVRQGSCGTSRRIFVSAQRRRFESD